MRGKNMKQMEKGKLSGTRSGGAKALVASAEVEKRGDSEARLFSRYQDPIGIQSVLQSRLTLRTHSRKTESMG